jgi:dihydrofolate reductase
MIRSRHHRTRKARAMRKFLLHVQTSVDGYMAGLTGDADWGTGRWTPDAYAHVIALHEKVDTILLGRRTAEEFIPGWKSEPEDEPREIVDLMNNAHRVVISNSLTESPWDNAVIAGDLTETVHTLKAEPGGDLIAYGGGTLVRALIANDLLDELHLFVNPVALGAGMPVFPTDAVQRLRLVTATPFDCGIIALHYEPKRS